MEPHTLPDMAGEIDQPEEILAEVLGVDLGTAKKVIDWHHEQIKKLRGEAVAFTVARIVGQLCRPGVNIPVQVNALALASDLAKNNNIKTQTEVAKKFRVTRSLISHYVTSWVDLLELKNTTYRKRDCTRTTFTKTAKVFHHDRIEKYRNTL